MEKKFINPPEINKPRGYTHAVTVEGGRMVFIAGQIALNLNGEVVGKGDLRAQAQQAWLNLAAALKAAGATLADLVKINTYVVNPKADDIRIVREVRSQVMTGDNLPASTLVGVSALAVEGLLIEIEGVAVVR